MITIDDGKIVNFKIPTTIEGNKIRRENSGKYFEALKNVLEAITDLTHDEIDNISIQEGIYLTVWFRGLHYSSFPIYETNDILTYPKELIQKDGTFEKRFLIIKGVEFFNSIPIKEAILAEKEATIRGLDNFPDMVLSAGCINGFKEGWEIIKNLKTTPFERGNYESLVHSISSYSPIFLKLNPFEDIPVTLVTQERKQGQPLKEFPFRPSLLLTL